MLIVECPQCRQQVAQMQDNLCPKCHAPLSEGVDHSTEEPQGKPPETPPLETYVGPSHSHSASQPKGEDAGESFRWIGAGAMAGFFVVMWLFPLLAERPRGWKFERESLGMSILGAILGGILMVIVVVAESSVAGSRSGSANLVRGIGGTIKIVAALIALLSILAAVVMKLSMG